ncbi:transglycosylase domain-containing protein [Catellatospora coxensis]|uniref:Glycosyl transferase family 51 domain-containing protein n=1 Tax=Catellatospora coxensis TaxID=310354 RepID=A0A8J3L693_9ACTN|nr:transglycosylase domain-containing protein [Catellatospora coxensis]GIG09939.1 hypothetical protein Cco03nite_66390 [Catellatospora coxensis]
MTIVELPKSAAAAMPPPRRRGLRRLVAAVVLLVLLAGVAYGLAQYYYASIPLPREREPGTQQVRAENLRPGVADAIVAAVDPDFYQQADELVWPSSALTKRYAVVAMWESWDDLDSWRVRVGAHKLEGWYTKNQLLDFYLNTAHYGQGAVGLEQASTLYFGKHPRDLTVTEAALLGVHLDPDPGDVRAAWNRVLDTMVEHGWLNTGERGRLVFPKTIQE